MQDRKCLLIFVLLFLVTGFFVSQYAKGLPSFSVSAFPAPPVDWINSDGYGCSVKQTADKGYIVAGGESARGGEHLGCWLTKIDESGDLQWKKTYLESGLVAGREAQQTADGGFMLAGYVEDAGSGAYFALLVKTDEFGSMEWNKTYGGRGNAVALSGQQTSDGGYVLAGWSKPVGVNHDDFYLVKTDSSGNVEWDKTYGGNSSDVAWSVQQTSDGGYILVGHTYSFAIEDYSDCWLVKTDSSGNMEWNKTYDKSPIDTAACIRQTTDGGYVYVGFTGGEYAEKYAFAIKTSSSGEREGEAMFSGEDHLTGRDWAKAYSVDETSDGGFIVAGDTSLSNGESGMFLWKTKLHAPSITDWSETYDGNARAVIQTDDGGYAVVGEQGLMKIMSESVVILARFRYSPATPIISESIVFNASYSYDRNLDIVSYLWNFDDGNITSAMNPIVVHRYENAGIYNVSLRIVDAEGLNSTCSMAVCAMTPTSILLSTDVPSATVGYVVNISATLLDFYGSRIGNETVDLYYAYSGVGIWNIIASNRTDIFGNLTAEWIPPAPSYFAIMVVYAGNYTHVGSSRVVSLSMLPYGEDYLFSVESNSTVSSMGFDTNSLTLGFTATGLEGTRGYAKVTAAKSLVPDLALLRVQVDGEEYDYNATETVGSWVLLFVYDHSVHLIEIQLDITIAEFNSSTILVLFMAATLFVAIFYKRKECRESSGAREMKEKKE